jgi:hypothetical protein
LVAALLREGEGEREVADAVGMAVLSALGVEEDEPSRWHEALWREIVRWDMRCRDAEWKWCWELSADLSTLDVDLFEAAVVDAEWEGYPPSVGKVWRPLYERKAPFRTDTLASGAVVMRAAMRWMVGASLLCRWDPDPPAFVRSLRRLAEWELSRTLDEMELSFEQHKRLRDAWAAERGNEMELPAALAAWGRAVGAIPGEGVGEGNELGGGRS